MRNGSSASETTEEGVAERLLELDELRNEFLAVVVHDMRTPSTIAAGFLKVLKEKWRSLAPDDVDQFLERAERAVHQIDGLVGDLLTVSRLESGQFGFDPVPFDLAALVRRTVASLEGSSPSTAVEVRAPDPLPLAYADETRHVQILQNLLSNAVKYSGEGATVWVEVSAVKGDHGPALAVSVRDEGVGIEEDDVALLFRPFSRLRDGGTVTPSGTGLGLYITKALVEAQGGHITIDSRAGRGSTFTYTVPVSRI